MEVGDRSVVGPKSNVLQSVPPESLLSGLVEAAPHKQWLRVMRLLPKLPALWRRVSELERGAGKPGPRRTSRGPRQRGTLGRELVKT